MGNIAGWLSRFGVKKNVLTSKEEAMKTILSAVIISMTAALSTTAFAALSILDPADGNVYSPSILTFKFSVSCIGGTHKIKWKLENSEQEVFFGNAKFDLIYKTTFRWKVGPNTQLPGGTYKFIVSSSCAGQESVTFVVN